jgi:hypothetical protein
MKVMIKIKIRPSKSHVTVPLKHIIGEQVETPSISLPLWVIWISGIPVAVCPLGTQTATRCLCSTPSSLSQSSQNLQHSKK